MKILLKKHFGWFYEKLNNDAIDSYAAQVSFWILISFIPFLMLILALLQVIRFEDTSLLVAFVQMLPPPVEEVVSYLFQEVHAPQTLISMTAITCVWSASTAMVALIKGLYSVFDVSKNHNYIFMRILAILYTVVFVMTLLVSMGLMVFGDMLYEWLITVMPPAFPTLINRFKPIMSYVLLLFFFWLMFIAIPRKQVSLRNAFFGAALASAGWVLFSFFFSVFVENFANYATIYGSLAALVILFNGMAVRLHVYFAHRRRDRHVAAAQRHQPRCFRPENRTSPPQTHLRERKRCKWQNRRQEVKPPCKAP